MNLRRFGATADEEEEPGGGSIGAAGFMVPVKDPFAIMEAFHEPNAKKSPSPPGRGRNNMVFGAIRRLTRRLGHRDELVGEKFALTPALSPREREELSERSLGSWSQYICMRKRRVSMNLRRFGATADEEEEPCGKHWSGWVHGSREGSFAIMEAGKPGPLPQEREARPPLPALSSPAEERETCAMPLFVMLPISDIFCSLAQSCLS